MTKEEIISEMDKCLDCASISGFKEQVDNILEINSEKEASLIIAQYLMTKYTAFKADGLASYMEAAIRKWPNLAVLNHPENPLFKLAVIRGSKELYDCYMEEAVLPFLSNVIANEHQDYFYELLAVAEKMDKMIFENYEPIIKGLHYNGAIPTEQPHLVRINKEDFEVIEDVVEQYNGIIGRKEILKDLNRRIEKL
ncbi:hypothetical protein LB467_11895 [Salegentibacter sp. JZCK2]|uniref:hypothetical protein n=1 Tax=Salegentibacter tibetensis TaxID=2873600 RepID=UPI001CCC6CFE|nr:hypothetical protein [Salegentibacter tibetensis]MBZ9730388.1 hypothetical protein [Salegentibacter tibetensis]